MLQEELDWIVTELCMPHVLNEVRLELRLGRTTVTLVRVLAIALHMVGTGSSDRIDKVELVVDHQVTVLVRCSNIYVILVSHFSC